MIQDNSDNHDLESGNMRLSPRDFKLPYFKLKKVKP